MLSLIKDAIEAIIGVLGFFKDSNNRKQGEQKEIISQQDALLKGIEDAKKITDDNNKLTLDELRTKNSKPE